MLAECRPSLVSASRLACAAAVLACVVALRCHCVARSAQGSVGTGVSFGSEMQASCNSALGPPRRVIAFLRKNPFFTNPNPTPWPGHRRGRGHVDALETRVLAQNQAVRFFSLVIVFAKRPRAYNYHYNQNYSCGPRIMGRMSTVAAAGGPVVSRTRDYRGDRYAWRVLIYGIGRGSALSTRTK